MKSFKNLTLELKDGIGILTLNQPEKNNMLGPDVWIEMKECQEILQDDETIRVVLICAEGKHFSGGLDLNLLVGATPRSVQQALRKFQPVYYGWETLDVPVIAAIQGKCLGNATELLLSCDLRMASQNAKFSFLEVKYAGIAPDMGGTAKLVRIAGIGQAKRMLLTGEVIDAEEAKRIGLVEYVVEDENLREEALKLARNIADQPPIGIMSAKKGINLASESSRYGASLYEQMQAMYCASTADMQEAIAAAMQRRKPNYKGE